MELLNTYFQDVEKRRYDENLLFTTAVARLGTAYTMCENATACGFVFRGIASEETRRASIVATPMSAVEGSIEDANVRIASLAKAYATNCREELTIINLVLEAEERLAGCIQEPPYEAQNVHLILGFGELSAVASEDSETKCIAFSEHVRSILHAHDSPSMLPQQVEACLQHLVLNEAVFFFEFTDYILGKNVHSRTLPLEKRVAEARVWLFSLGHLKNIVDMLGNHLLVMPVTPFRNQLGPHHPLMAFAVFSRDHPDINSKEDACKYFHVEGLSGRSALSDNAHRHFLEDIEAKIAPDGKEDLLRDLRSVLAHNCAAYYVMLLAASLIGKKHESMPLRFKLLTAPSAFQLSTFESDGGDVWRLTRLQTLDRKHFPVLRPSTQGDAGSFSLSPCTFAIESNALLLQEPGVALFFPTVATSAAPTAVIRVDAYTEDEWDAFTRVFTARSTETGAIAIDVSDRQARVYLGGTLRATLHKTFGVGEALWKPSNRGLEELLLDRARGMAWWDNLTGESEGAVRRSFQVAADVAKRGLGCLLWLVHGKGLTREEMSLMGPVWSNDAEHRRIQDVDVSLIAAMAALDGETVVDLASGEFFARQFLHVPAGRKIDILEETGGELKLASYLVRKWEAVEVPDSLDTLAQFGTRHRKALQITYAYSEASHTELGIIYPGKQIVPLIGAITVSEAGPVRIWDAGVAYRVN